MSGKDSSKEKGNTSNSKHQPIGDQNEKEEDMNKDIEKLSLLKHISFGKSSSKSLIDAKQKDFQFWKTQPVPGLNEEIHENNWIEADKPISSIRQEAYSLPESFCWDEVDLNQAVQLQEVYTLLNENYVEDDDNMFRFDYSPDFLLWAIQPPGWLKSWHLGVRVKTSSKLVCFISAIPFQARVHDKSIRLVEINFLCVHKKLRNKRVAPVLIREITRRVNLTGIFQAVYTAGVVLPKPIGTCRYWHRSLNPKKLIECKFSSLARNMTLRLTVKLYKLPDSPLIAGFQPLQERHLEKAFVLLSEYLSKFKFYPEFNREEFRHWFLPRDDVIYSYVVENDAGDVVAMSSFYCLPSSVIQHPVHKSLKAAYSFYNVAGASTWTELMRDTLIEARNRGFDVFNTLDLMDNRNFLTELKFGSGDGNLNYYLYNWRCPGLKPEEMALVLQ